MSNIGAVLADGTDSAAMGGMNIDTMTGRGSIVDDMRTDVLAPDAVCEVTGKGFVTVRVTGRPSLIVADVRTQPTEVIDRVWADMLGPKGFRLVEAMRAKNRREIYFAERAIGA